MKNLGCPQCEIQRFFVKNEKGESRLVTVDESLSINLVHPDESLEGFDLNLLFCLGCSWSGSPKTLTGRKNIKHY